MGILGPTQLFSCSAQCGCWEPWQGLWLCSSHIPHDSLYTHSENISGNTILKLITTKFYAGKLNTKEKKSKLEYFFLFYYVT
jgi:hypothetical protein